MLWWSIVILAIFLIGLTKSGFGSGAGLMIVPMTAFAMANIPGYGADAALALLLPLLIVGDLLAIWQYRKVLSMRIVRRLLPGTALGVVLGSLILGWFVSQQRQVTEALINISIGFESVTLVLLQFYRIWRARGELPPYVPRIWRSFTVGAVAGVSSTLAHAAGPIIALHLLPQKLERGMFVGTGALYFAILNASKLPAYYQVGLFQKISPTFALFFMPLVIAGALFGYWVNRRISDRIFSNTLYAITFLLGWYILLKGATQLRRHIKGTAMSSDKSKVALVTGASRGIGRAIALELARCKFDCAINYVSNTEAANEVKKLVESSGQSAHLIQADIGESPDRQKLIDQTFSAFGRLDLLVNNAGVAPQTRVDLLEATEDSFDRVIRINLKGPYFLSQLAARKMIEQVQSGRAANPKIVTISSVSAYTASVNRGEYCVAKAGLSMMTKLFAARLAEFGINVYEIRPGIIETDMTGPVKAKYDKLILEQDLTPIHRWGKPEDVANAVAAIASDRLPFSTGEVINVDGGFHMRRL
jgi:3-oxoacyl-[acyl-carrier protein] reductase